MKLSLCCLLLTSASIVAAPAIPTPYGRERYEGTLEKAPFALATPPAEAAPPPKPDPFKDLYLVGVSKAENKDYVVIQKVGGESFRLWGGDVGPDGIQLLKINENDIPGKTTVNVQQGQDRGEIRFPDKPVAPTPGPAPVNNRGAGNPAMANQPGANPALQNQAQIQPPSIVPGGRAPSGGGRNRGPVGVNNPGVAPMANGGRPAIPGNPGGIVPANTNPNIQGVPGGNPNLGPGTERRIRQRNIPGS